MYIFYTRLCNSCIISEFKGMKIHFRLVTFQRRKFGWLFGWWMNTSVNKQISILLSCLSSLVLTGALIICSRSQSWLLNDKSWNRLNDSYVTHKWKTLLSYASLHLNLPAQQISTLCVHHMCLWLKHNGPYFNCTRVTTSTKWKVSGTWTVWTSPPAILKCKRAG